MATGILHAHYFVVTLFLLIYVIKTILLLSDKKEMLANFTKKVKVFEMVVSVLFLATGIYLASILSYNGKFDYLFYIKIVMVLAAIPLAIIGFKKSNKALAVISLLLILGSFGLAEVYHKKKGISKGAEIASDSLDGKVLYEANCSSCHGNDGKLGLSGSKNLAVTELDESGIKDIVVHGKGLMPAAQVNDEQAAAIAQYVNGSIKGH
jgi:uncharacterized membrane protein SirB2